MDWRSGRIFRSLFAWAASTTVMLSLSSRPCRCLTTAAAAFARRGGVQRQSIAPSPAIATAMQRRKENQRLVMLYSSTTNTNNNHINHINNNNNNNKLKKKQAPNAHTISSSSSSAPSFSQREKKDAEKKKNKGTASTSFTNTAAAAARRTVSRNDDDKVLNLSTVTLEELECFIVGLGFPKYRASQVYHWIRTKGVTQVTHMTNLPVSLQEALLQYSKPSALTLITEQISKVDGTIKRAYACQSDGAVIESVLMGPYKDGRYTACISSQAGCAQGCVFCATGQMGFTRQLTSDEIFEQVSQFASHLLLQRKDDNTEETAVSKNHGQLHGKSKRLSNVVFMGMGEPLANYKNVVTAVNRISQDLGIGARKITVSTVGIVANIRKLTTDPNVPQVRLAVSLHCVDDEERTALLPANDRNGGLKELMSVLREYIDTTGRRITLEWALIAGENDDQGTARKLGRLVKKYRLRPDMVHVNVIPLNPTSAYEGKPSQKGAVNLFCETLQQEFGIACTPRVRRGIDIDAGCGQLTTAILQKERDTKQLPSKETGTAARQLSDFMPDSSFHPPQSTSVGFFQDDDDGDTATIHSSQAEFKSKYSLDCTVDVHDFDHEDFEDPELKLMEEKQEASRLISLIQGTTIHLGDIN